MTAGHRAPRRGAQAALAVAIALAGGAAASGCHPAKPEPVQAAPRGASSEAPPLDRLAAGELFEGSAKAFGLVLPRDLRVDGAFADKVYASGRASVHPVVLYLQSRLQDGDLREGEHSATFDCVRVRALPGPELRVHIAQTGEGVAVTFEDFTPPEIPVLPDETARWRHVGLTPDGRLADPTHVE